MNRDKNTAIFVAYDDLEPTNVAGAERSLLCAILVTALGDLRKEGDLAKRAEEYFMSVEDDYLFSFRSVCDYLALDPDRVLDAAGLRGKRRQGPDESRRAPARPGRCSIEK